MATILVVDDSAENVAAVHRPMVLATRFGDRNLLIEALMRARCVEELHIFTHHSSKIGLIDDEYPSNAHIHDFFGFFWLKS